MEHKIIFLPAWDKSDPDPTKDYGVNCINIKFLVIGNRGVVEFDLSTNWYLPHIIKRRLEHLKQDVFIGKEDYLLTSKMSPYPLDICYYSLERISEDDTYFESGLSYVFDHKPCYYGYRYEDEGKEVWTTDFVYNLLLERGDGAVWDYLENYYCDTFLKDDEKN